MEKVINLAKRKKEKAELEKEEKRKKDNEWKKRMKYLFTTEEACLLQINYLSMIELLLDKIRDEEYAEEKDTDIKEITDYLSLLKRLNTCYSNTAPYDDISMSWNFNDLYLTVCAMEMLLDLEISEYVKLSLTEKIELNLYGRLKSIEKSRLQILHPTLYQLYYKDSISIDYIKQERLKEDNMWSMFEFNFQKEFHQRFVLIEESRVISMGNVVRQYFVQTYPNDKKGLLDQLSKNDEAGLVCTEEILLDKEEPFPFYQFPQGWRISTTSDCKVENKEVFVGLKVEVIQMDDYKKEQEVHRNSIKELQKQLDNVIKACIKHGIVNQSYPIQ